MRLTLTILFAIAVVALSLGIAWESIALVAVSALASLPIIAVGIAADGWRALNPFSRRQRR